jgi:hypothetical protein
MKVLPNTANEACDGGLIWDNIVALQQTLTNKRNVSLNSRVTVLSLIGFNAVIPRLVAGCY